MICLPFSQVAMAIYLCSYQVVKPQLAMWRAGNTDIGHRNLQNPRPVVAVIDKW